jgi:glycosyltransferase involved in cell wall biosynthesis
MKNINLSIIIPCYNEAHSIPLLFKKIEAIQKDYFEIILINNGSTDDTKNILKQLNVNFNITVVSLKENLGYGNGIIEGIKIANGKIISWTHADLQTDPKDVIDAYKFYIKQGDAKKFILKGKRINRKLIDRFFTFMMSLISSILLGAKLSDINAQPKMFHRDYFGDLDQAPKDFSLDLFFLYKGIKSGKTILEYPVFFSNRLYGESKGGGSLKGKIKLIKRTMAYILILRKSIKK